MRVGGGADMEERDEMRSDEMILMALPASIEEDIRA